MCGIRRLQRDCTFHYHPCQGEALQPKNCLRQCCRTYPAREEFLVALAALVATKARYGLDWFEEKWSSPQGCLFPLENAA
jgi:hypothetical protein